MAETIGGALREIIISQIPGVQVYRKTAPPNSELPLIVINENISATTQDLGDEFAITEEVQVDLYLEYASTSNLPDQLHAAMHKKPLQIPSSHIHRCSVLQRQLDVAAEGNDDGVERITYSVAIIRMIPNN